MRIGEKIKALRQDKLMTQSELAGNHITRNMLSSIEHGTALPSLPTAQYLAERLGVPVGYLLAEDAEEPAYRKMTAMQNIRRAFSAGDWSGTLALVGACGADRDDELAMIRARCEYGIAKTELLAGRLRAAAMALDRALLAADTTVYDTAWLRQRIAVYFRYLSGVSATLDSDVLDADEIESALDFGDELSEYILALEQLERDDIRAAERFAERHQGSLFAARLAALLQMKNEEYAPAQTALERLLGREELTFGPLLYEVFGDLERCYRENDDYKRAYEFSGSRLTLLERLLEEV